MLAVAPVRFDATAAHLLPIAITVPIVIACVLIAGRAMPRWTSDALAVAAALGVAGIDGAALASTTANRVVAWAGGWQPRHGFSVGVVLVADPLNAGLALLTAALMAAALLYSWRYFESAGAHYQALMLLFLAGMQGFAFSGDLFDMFVFFELMGAVAYALTGLKIEDRTSVQGALNFGIINSLGAYLSLAGVAVLYSRTGQLGLAQLGHALDHQRPDALIVGGFVLVSCGFLVKAAVVPFHFWLADAHAVAPSSVCVLFSGVMVELGLYGFARVYWIVFGGTLPGDDIRRAFVVIGLVTAVVAATMCFCQRHVKRLLAYSTIAHVGLFLVAVATLTAEGTAGAALYVAGHAGVKAALFLLAGLALNRYGSVDEWELYGRGKDDRLTGVLFLLAGLALAGLPPFATAIGKGVAEEAVAKAGYPWGPALFVIVSAVTGGAVIRAGLRIYFAAGPRPHGQGQPATRGDEERDVSTTIPRHPPTMMLAIVGLLAGSFVLGVVPRWYSAFGNAAQRFVDRNGYIAQTLTAAPATVVHHLPDVSWTASSVVLGTVSALLAVVFAFAGLYHERAPQPVALVGRAFGPPLRVLRGVHSGHIGDYAAWVLVGLAGIGALVGLPLR